MGVARVYEHKNGPARRVKALASDELSAENGPLADGRVPTEGIAIADVLKAARIENGECQLVGIER